jgi:hypothetical protein
MDITMMLAQVWGPIMIALGLGFFFSPSFYTRVYRDLEQAPFAVICFGMIAMAAGIFQIHAHNVWETAPQILISFFGWGLLVKGFICTAFPGMADRGGDWALSSKLVPTIGWVVVLLGAYLSWVGYFA